MQRFLVLIFEFNTGEKIPAATLWFKVSTDEKLKEFIPIDFEDTFTSSGPIEVKAALRLADLIKETFSQLGVEFVEHATSDD
jgi:hypothetical protein